MQPTQTPKSRIIWWVSGIIAILVIVGIILHFVPIREEKGFIASVRTQADASVTCVAVTAHVSYRLILNQLADYDQTKDKFGKNVANGPCPPGVDTTISLYVF